MYQHKDNNGNTIDLPVGKVVCVGRNYLDHIKEMDSSVPEQPLLFMKPSTALVAIEDTVSVPTQWGECHNELELAVLIKSPLKRVTQSDALAGVWGVGVGLDLTLRDIQSQLKRDGYPWERAKAFDGSCPMGPFAPLTQFNSLDDIAFSLEVNEHTRQQGNSGMMCWNIPSLIAAISDVFTLIPGDIVMTGTPKGVAALQPDDQLVVRLANLYNIRTRVTAQ